MAGKAPIEALSRLGESMTQRALLSFLAKVHGINHLLAQCAVYPCFVHPRRFKLLVNDASEEVSRLDHLLNDELQDDDAGSGTLEDPDLNAELEAMQLEMEML